MAEKPVWKASLRPNTLTPDNPNDCIAVVKSDTKTNDDLAGRIVSERSEFRKETILSILTIRDKLVKNYIEEGASFRDGLVQISPRISGVWESAMAQFDPAIHRRTVDVTLTQDMRNALDAIAVNVIDRNATATTNAITLVTNSLSGEADGTIPIGEDIIIDGDKIKIQDEKDEEQGVFIIDAEGKEHKVTRKLIDNKAKRLIARIPSDFPEGEAKIVIKTKYAGSGTALKTVRSIPYNMILKAVK